MNPTPFGVTVEGPRTSPAVIWNAADETSHRMLNQRCGHARRSYELPPRRRLVFDPGDLPIVRTSPFRVTVVGEGRPTSRPIVLPPLFADVERDGEVRLAVRGPRPGLPYPLVVLENGTDAPITYEGDSLVAPTHVTSTEETPRPGARERNATSPKRFTVPAGKGIGWLQLHLGLPSGRAQWMHVQVTKADGEVVRRTAGPFE